MRNEEMEGGQEREEERRSCSGAADGATARATAATNERVGGGETREALRQMILRWPSEVLKAEPKVDETTVVKGVGAEDRRGGGSTRPAVIRSGG